MSTTVNHDVHSVTVNLLLAGLGFDDARLDNRLELAIDRFDQWTNPRAAMLACTCSLQGGRQSLLERAA